MLSKTNEMIKGRSNYTLHLFIVLILISHIGGNLKGQTKGLTKQQIQSMQESTIEVVKNLYSNMNMIAMFSSDNSSSAEVRKIIIDTKTYFDKKDVIIKNNLIIRGSDIMKMDEYMNAITIVFSLNPGSIEIIEPTASTVYINSKGYYIVKITGIVKIQGKDMDNKLVNNVDQLDIYLRFYIKNNNYEPPVISSIINNKDEKKILKPVEIIEKSLITSNIEKNKELQKKLAESKNIQTQQKEQMQRMQAKLNELYAKENQIKIIKEQAEKSLLIAQQTLRDAVAKQEESDARAREVQQKEKQLESKQDQINNQKKEIKKQKDNILKLQKTINEQEAKLGIDKKNQYSKRIALNFGAGLYFNNRTLEETINGDFNSNFNPNLSISGMVGYRFDMRTPRINQVGIVRGNIFGVFVNYGLNSTNFINTIIEDQHLIVPPNTSDKIHNRTFDVEMGFVFYEFFRLSSGTGSMNAYRYLISTAGFEIPVFKKFNISFGSSFMYGLDFDKIQMRPYASFSFQLNDKIAHNLSDNEKGRFINQITTEITGTYFKGENIESMGQNMNSQVNIYTAVRIKEKSSLGFFSTFGSYNKDVAQNIISLYTNYSDTINDNYNPFTNLALGYYALGKIRISAGYGNFFYNNYSDKVPYYSFTIGTSIPIIPKKDLLRFNFDLATKIINNSFDNIMFTVSTGLALRFNLGK